MFFRHEFSFGGATKEFTLRKGASSWKSLRTTGLTYHSNNILPNRSLLNFDICLF